jgi:hypothetical protein
MVRHWRRNIVSRLPAGTHLARDAICAHPYCQRQQFHHLMAPDPRTATVLRVGERLLTLAADLRNDHDDLVHLRNRKP